jgi:antitoxin MazE
MRTQIAKWGNSLAVRLPRQVAEAAGLEEGSSIDLDVIEGAVKLTPARPVFTLDDLLGRITPATLPDEIFDDGPKGREIL